MARAKIKKITTRRGIRFEIEANADKMLREALDDMPNQIDKDDDNGKQVPPPKTTSSAKATAHQIDLHGLTLAESQRHIDTLLRRVVTHHSNVRIKIITGKGRHQQRGENLLARDVHSWLQHKYRAWIVEIEQSPDAVRIGALPWRGHFEVVMRKSN